MEYTDLTLHSTMFLLKQTYSDGQIETVNALHSTMFLLKRCCEINDEIIKKPLHSTMFLLKPVSARISAFFLPNFTFHNVSIKTA